MRFEGVAVAGVGMVPFGMLRDRPILHLARDAGLLALHDADMTLADVDEAFVGYIQLASMIGIKAMKELGLTGLPVTHIENASATGLVAFREAAWAVSSGRADVAMALCFDKFTDMAGGGGRGGGRDVIDAPILPASYFALWAQRRMHDRGTTPTHFASIAAKNWNYGAACPTAHRRPDHTITAEEVLASRMVAQPLTTMMCCPADDGAACVILAREDLVRSRQPGRTLVRPLASALQSESYARGHTFVGPVVGPSTMTRDTARECYEAAGIGPEDVQPRVLSRRVRERGARVLRAARLLRRGRRRQARRGRRDRPRRSHPVQHRRRADRAWPPGWADRSRADPRIGAAAAGRGDAVARSTARASRSRTSSAAAASAR